MNTPVSFENAKLLKEKGFDIPTLKWYHRETKKLNTNDLIFSMNKLTDNYSAPTIAEVVMWLYKKHGIWISVFKYKDHAADLNDPYLFRNQFDRGDYDSPKKAYEAGIEFALKNLIK